MIRTSRPLPILPLLAVLTLLFTFAVAAAQPQLLPVQSEGLLLPDAPAETSQEEAGAAGDTADEAVTGWLSRSPLSVQQLTELGPAELCQELPNLLLSPPPPADTHVNLADRTLKESADGNVLTFTYSARYGSGNTEQLQVVQVVLQQTEAGEWDVQQVGFRPPPARGLRLWIQTPEASIVFIALSLVTLLGLFWPGPLRRWLARGFQVIRTHRRTYIFTLVLLFGIFGLGMFTGSQLPAECTDAIITTVNSAVTAVGAAEAYGSGSIPRAATVTFHQNFVVVTMSVTFSLALLFGVPAYLFALLSFYAQAIPFGLPGIIGLADLPFVLLLLLLELTAYFTIVAGGGFFLATLIRKGFPALPEAFTNLVLMVPIAYVLLLIGAWYEAVILLL